MHGRPKRACSDVVLRISDVCRLSARMLFWLQKTTRHFLSNSLNFRKPRSAYLVRAWQSLRLQRSCRVREESVKFAGNITDRAK